MAKPEWAEEFEEEARHDNLKPLILRRKIRYLLFLLQGAAGGQFEVEEAHGVPSGFQEFFEDQKWFDGWENFGITWDVGDPYRSDRASDDPLEVVPRYQSVQEEWQEVIELHVKADTVSARKRARARRMEEANGNEDNV